MMYKLSQKTLNAIEKARLGGIVRKLATALECSDSTINRAISANDTNGDLTKKAAIEVIRKVTGLKLAEILEEVLQKERA